MLVDVDEVVCGKVGFHLRQVPFWFHGFFIVVSLQHRFCIVLQSGSKRLVEGIPQLPFG
jgi:hypothetical protein